ncbi:MAG TPA: response regulator transcription factor [Acidimicrobiia bacterium]|nr:response regulator transcription factor [Acidimicrobiia bacterium]
MTDERPIRVWLEDRNAVFRLGLAACLESPDVVLAGQSASFSPTPDVARTDVLLFGLGESELEIALSLSERGPLPMVALADRDDDELLVRAVEAGVAGALVRPDVTPDAVLHCLRSVVRQNAFLPAAVLVALVHGSPAGCRRADPGALSGRELDVLRLLSQGGSTREIAGDLCYSEKTVKNIVHDVLVRLSCRNRAEAVAVATRQGLI